MSERETSDRPEAIWRSLASLTSGEESLRRKLLEILLAPAELRKMTYEEFLAWADEDTLAEWVGGEVVMYTPTSKRHQNIADFLTGVLRTFVEQHHRLGSQDQLVFDCGFGCEATW
jgi:Uma2 family endonuclease